MYVERFDVIGREVENAQPAKRAPAAARPLRARQEATASATATVTPAQSAASSASSTASAVSSAASANKATSSAATTSAAAASDASSLPVDAALSTDESGHVQTVLKLITPPPWTETSWTAYNAPGTNTTTEPPPTTLPSSSMVRFPGLVNTATTTEKTTTVHTAPWAWATAHGIPENELTKCSIDGKNTTWGPFCSPNHNQEIYAGTYYAFTWNGDLFPINATNRVQVQYVDQSLGNVTVGDPVPSYQGYYNIEFEEAWLKGADGNDTSSGQNMTVSLISSPFGGGPDKVLPGPAISLVKNPKTLPKIIYPKIAPKYGLEIGLPVGLVALLIIILSLCCVRKVRGHHMRDARLVGQDYMAKRNRRRGLKSDGIQLDQMETEGEMAGQYTDQPVRGGNNAFRDEIRRQREEDDASLKRSVTSY